MPELGKKYECAECGTKFYDLGKAEPICPKCGTNQRGLQEPPKTAPAPRVRAAVVAPPPVEVPDEDLPADIGDEDEEILEVVPGEEEEEEEEDDEA